MEGKPIAVRWYAKRGRGASGAFQWQRKPPSIGTSQATPIRECPRCATRVSPRRKRPHCAVSVPLRRECLTVP